jgi:uncharacterized Zn-finger protein
MSADAAKWYSCDKCEFKTIRNHHLNRHKIIHLSVDAVQWYSCDKCEFETKRNDNLKQHKKSHLSADTVKWRHKRLVCQKLPKTLLNQDANKNCS